MSDFSAPSPAVADDGPMRIGRAVLVVTGVVSLLAGILVLAYPGPSLLVVALIAGLNLVVIGVLGLVDLVFIHDDEDEGPKLMRALVYTSALIAGIVVLRHPADSVLAVVVILGAWFVVAGVLGLIAVARHRGERWQRALASLAELAVGVLALSLPDVSVKTIAILAGIAFVIRGIVLLFEGVRYAHDAVPE